MQWTERKREMPGWYFYSVGIGHLAAITQETAAIAWETSASSAVSCRGWHLWIGNKVPTVHPTLKAAEKALEAHDG